jgi:hypothetical protein
MYRIFCIALILTLFVLDLAHAQRGRGRDNTVVYEELYDDPYDINKLFVMFQPLYGEVFVSNMNVGFGLEAQYYLKDKAHFRAHGRKAYARPFDMERNIAEKNNIQQNTPEVFRFYELGGTYHIKDEESDTESKMILLRSKEDLKKLKAKVPEQIIIPSKKRTIYGARLGGMSYVTATDLDRVLTNENIMLPAVGDTALSIGGDQSLFTNVTMYGIYLGGQYTKIKNFAVKPDRTYGNLVNDLMFTAYLDIIYAPSVQLENILLDGVEYSLDEVGTTSVGFRAGMEGKFNREWSWAYNAELGLRPGLKSRGFYALIKLSFPVFGTQLNYTKEAFGK